jgi:hypothetical protein
VTCQCRDTKWRQQYSSNTFVTLQLEGVGFQHYTPISLPALPRKTRYPMHRSLGGPRAQSGRKPNISPSPRIDLPTVQALVSCYAGHMYEYECFMQSNFLNIRKYTISRFIFSNPCLTQNK